MATDIKLDTENGNWVTIEGFILHSTTADFMLDHAARRRAGSTSRYRRALVHDFQDGLTINYSGDYPGGVTMYGGVTMHGGVTIDGATEVPDGITTSRIVIEHFVDAPSSVVGLQPPTMPVEIDVGAEIMRLQDRVLALEAKSKR